MFVCVFLVVKQMNDAGTRDGNHMGNKVSEILRLYVP